MKIHHFHTYITLSLTGLSDQGHEGRWVWQHSVEDVDFESWAPGQPEGIVSFILTQQTILDSSMASLIFSTMTVHAWTTKMNTCGWLRGRKIKEKTRMMHIAYLNTCVLKM